MSKFKFINIVDTLFILVVILLIIFAWVQYFIKNLILSIAISLIISIGIIVLLYYLKSKKYNNAQSVIKRNKDFSVFKIAIQTLSISKFNAIIKKIIPSQYNARCNNNNVYFEKEKLVYIATSYFSNELSESCLLNIIKEKKCDNLIVFCSSYSQNAKSILNSFKNLKIELVDLEQLFELFNKKNIVLDTSNISLANNKIQFKQLLKNIISRNKSKGYFISGLVLLFTSIIIPYKIYYVIFSSILFTLSILSRFKPSPKINISIFD